MDGLFPVDMAVTNSSSYFYQPVNRNNVKNEFLLMLCEEMLKSSFNSSVTAEDSGFKSPISEDLAVKIAARKLAEQIGKGLEKNYTR